MTPPFRPLFGTGGGHRQTLLGYLVRRRQRWTGPVEDLVVDVGEDVRLLVRASWQPGPREESPVLVLVHGLAGADSGSHVVTTAKHAWAHGWHVLRMNMRGAGDSEAVCARLYNAGLDRDLLAVLKRAAACAPHVAVTGFSLGGALTLLTAGRLAKELPRELFAVAAVSPPLDLALCTDEFAKPKNALYSANFMGELRASYRSRQQRLPELYARDREVGLRSIRAYDDVITAHYGGYRDAAHYYAESSSGPHLRTIDRPTLILAAADDPMIPIASLTHWPLPESGVVTREITRTGGHVGFVGRTRAPGFFWAAERVLDFLQSALATDGGRRGDTIVP